MAVARPLLLALISAVPLLAQDSPPTQPPAVTVRLLTRIDDGLGGTLKVGDGAAQEFHIEVSATRARLSPARMPTNSGAGLAIGGAVELALLAALEQWCDTTFTVEEQTELLAPERLPSPRTEEQDTAHRRASLLRTVRAYRQVTRPAIDKVFAGRGTVTLSLQLRLAGGAPRQVLWRRFGDAAFARMHVDTDVEPVAWDSRDECTLVLAIGTWLAAQLGGREALWQGEHAAAPADVRLVLAAYRGYLSATAPRLRTDGTIMDGAPAGSRSFTLSDAQNRTFDVLFDFRAGSTTTGRLRDGGSSTESPVVEVGSARERELLALLQRAADLRRQLLGAEKAAADLSLRGLVEHLAAYTAKFHPDKASGKAP